MQYALEHHFRSVKRLSDLHCVLRAMLLYDFNKIVQIKKKTVAGWTWSWSKEQKKVIDRIPNVDGAFFLAQKTGYNYNLDVDTGKRVL